MFSDCLDVFECVDRMIKEASGEMGDCERANSDKLLYRRSAIEREDIYEII